jgi:hypothetical protein
MEEEPMLTTVRTRVTAAVAATAMAAGVAAPSAVAQPQNGLVNVDVSNNTVQVPIAVAANVCGVQVGILAQKLRQGPVDCDATTTATAVDNGNGSANS